MEIHSETETTDETPAKFRRIKLSWRTPQLDKFISFADDAIIAKETNKNKRKAAREFRASRAEYSPETVEAEDQLPPQKFPKCLIKESFLSDQLDQATVESLNLSDTVVDLNPVLEILGKKLGKGNRMDVSAS